MRRSTPEHFWERVAIGGPDECWPWTGGVQERGYGTLTYQLRSLLAHRLAYELTFGPIPHELACCHHCDNPPCCNPRHLWLGTRADNNLDKESKGRGVNLRGEAHGRAKLTWEQVGKIRERYTAGEGTRLLASEFGVHRNLIYMIVHGQIWKVPA